MSLFSFPHVPLFWNPLTPASACIGDVQLGCAVNFNGLSHRPSSPFQLRYCSMQAACMSVYELILSERATAVGGVVVISVLVVSVWTG
ncbi:hypothetical protein QCA50_007615 [Cerrena zonata]|uniref:Secreted protein n=1 Tax=Cerrena zonata TaxID=2478898 RepID=A0AAW0GC68_9APHY